jgi:hypothetical protein
MKCCLRRESLAYLPGLSGSGKTQQTPAYLLMPEQYVALPGAIKAGHAAAGNMALTKQGHMECDQPVLGHSYNKQQTPSRQGFDNQLWQSYNSQTTFKLQPALSETKSGLIANML